MPSLIAWLHEPFYDSPPWEFPIPAVPPSPTRLQVYAALIGLNGGGTEVHGWGIHASGGLYGTTGLSQRSAAHFCGAMARETLAGRCDLSETAFVPSSPRRSCARTCRRERAVAA